MKKVWDKLNQVEQAHIASRFGLTRKGLHNEVEEEELTKVPEDYWKGLDAYKERVKEEKKASKPKKEKKEEPKEKKKEKKAAKPKKAKK